MVRVDRDDCKKRVVGSGGKDERNTTYPESSVLPPRSFRPNFGLPQLSSILEIAICHRPRDAARARTSRSPPRSELGESLSAGSEMRYKEIYVPLPHFCVPGLPPPKVCA